MVAFVDVCFFLPIIDEFLGWLPARALRRTQRRTRFTNSINRLIRYLQLFRNPYPIMYPSYEDMLRSLWMTAVGPLRRCQTPAVGPINPGQGSRPTREVVVRYYDQQPWYEERGSPWDINDLMQAFPDPSFNSALHMIQAHGQHVVRRHMSTMHRINSRERVLVETIAVDCVLLGFEISLRMTFRTVLPSA